MIYFYQFWAATIEINDTSSMDRKERQTWHWALTEQNPFNVGGKGFKLGSKIDPAWHSFNFISNKAKMILKICKNVRKKSNIIILLLVFGWHQSSSVYRLFVSIVIWLFADFSLNVSRCLLAHRTSVFRCQHFILALCFNNKLCTHLCMRAGYVKKNKNPCLPHFKDGGGRCLWLDLHKKKK